MTLPLWRSHAFAFPSTKFEVNPQCELSQENIKKLLDIALSHGGEFAEVYVEYSVNNGVSLAEDKISKATYGIDMGVGFRVIHGEKTGYAFSDDLDFEKLKQAAEVASFIAVSEKVQQASALKMLTIPSYYLVKVPPHSIATSTKAELIMKANAAGREYNPKVNDVWVSMFDQTKKVMIANSEGVMAEDLQTQSGLFVSISAKDGEKRSTGYAYKSGTLGSEHYNEQAANDLVREAGRMAMAMLPAEDAPAGEFPIVMNKGLCGTFFHEAIGHSLESDSIRNKESCFCDKLGKMIASNIVNLADDGTIKGSTGTVNVDDEGTPGQKNIVIEQGKCTGFLQDRLNARLMNAQLTGNGRRESYQYYPIPRMTCTYLMPGQDDPEDMVKSVNKGIYITRISGGNVMTATGEFVFDVPESYMIENGTITKPVKGIQLMGNGPDVLKNIVMVGPDLEVHGGGMCGKSRQSKPVSDGNPTLKVSKITIGGSTT